MADHGSRARRPLIAALAAFAVLSGTVWAFSAGRLTETDSPAAGDRPGSGQSQAIVPTPPPAVPESPTQVEETAGRASPSPPGGPSPGEAPSNPADGTSTNDGSVAGLVPAPGLQPDPGLAQDADRGNVPQPVLPPSGLDGQPNGTDGVRVRVSAVQSVDGTAEGIGEIAGPSIRFTVSVTNETQTPLDLMDVVVTVDAGAEALPAGELSGPDVSPFPARAETGETVSGTYVFLVPVELRQQVRISLNYSPEEPIVVFEGPVSTG